jgi:adenine-specific DNA-methyltransferase
VGNPPYVPITELSETERSGYRSTYATAQGRFDLYLLFFEQALKLLKPRGRLVFITPEKYLYVDTARTLRRLLRQYHVEELHFLDEQTFADLVTYPLVSSIVAGSDRLETRVVGRHGGGGIVKFSGRDTSWLPVILGSPDESPTLRLTDVCIRISCGVATGADSVFVVKSDRLDSKLRQFAHPTIAGRELRPTTPPSGWHSLLVPYTDSGALISEEDLGALAPYLNEASRRQRLLRRTCVARKPWYAFHETPPMAEVLKPKLLCKDITASPFFIADHEGKIIPRHSVYYIVPREVGHLDNLVTYLNSQLAQDWLRANCQRAANDFLRVQSRILKRLPIPSEFVTGGSARAATERRVRSA